MKRSKRKGPFFSNCLKNLKRNSIILKYLNQQTIKVHNGFLFNTLTISKDLFYFKLGSFFPTRKKFRFKKI